ncbi:class F sortase [Tessaracoccus caeni]|uniref:class F sortase n=1 Tax=Tessaracoccus caeni TaxID=3031239 RepID=UPI0023DA7582|nr:class F sortase [Tessaracoccus caeni]MDF1487891.1 class F sortase [Tessaracoccus caeni]
MTSSQRRVRYAVIAVVAVILVALVYYLSRPDGQNTEPKPTGSVSMVTEPSATSSPAPAASPSPSVSVADSPPAGCVTTATEGFTPTRYTIESLDVDEPVVSLPLTDDGSIPAPPKREARVAAWWNEGPIPGDDEGRVILSIHTYRNGGALGNELLDEKTDKTPLKKGDIIALHDDKGNTACYEYADFTEIVAADYDPNSDVMIKEDGAPSLVLIICTAFDWDTEIWENRALFYADAI